MALLYKRRIALKDSHRDRILALSFSPDGYHLASASVDGRLCIWVLLVTQPSFQIESPVAFLSLQWLDNRTVVAGMEDGRVAFFRFCDKFLSATGFDAHIAPLECLSTFGTTVATGAHSEVTIWCLTSSPSSNFFERCVLAQRLGSPPTTAHNSHLPVIVTSLQWAHPNSSQPDAIFAGYLDHGVVMWDISTGDTLRSISTSTRIGTVLLSPCGRLLVTANLTSGFDVYHAEKMTPVRKFVHRHPSSSTRLFLPVGFTHEGNAVVGSLSPGVAAIWDLWSEDTIQTLPHEDNPDILAISSHYDYENDSFFIATALLSDSGSPTIQIWQTQPVAGPHSNIANDRTKRLKTHLLHVVFALLVGLVLPYILPLARQNLNAVSF